MADRSFEEAVRDALSGLSFEPDTEIWEQVATELHKKNRRRFVAWFFFFALAGAGAIIWMYHQDNTSDMIHPPVRSTETAKQTLPAKDDHTTTMDGEPAEATVKENHIAVADEEEKNGTQNESSHLRSAITKQPLPQVSQAMVDNKAKTAVTTNTLPGKQTFSEKNETGTRVKNEDEVAKTDKKPVLTTNIDSSLVKAKIDPLPVTKATDSVISPAGNETKKESVEIKKAKRSWQWYASLDFGESSLRNSLGFARAYAVPLSAVNAINSGNLFTSTAGPQTNNGFSFGAAVEAHKPISKKWDLGFSFAYQYYETRIHVGKRVDTTVSSLNTISYTYYSNGTQEVYHNRYHFLQTGIAFYRNFHVNPAWSLRWQAGVTGNLLIAANALHYDSQKNILVKNNAFLYSFQAALSTGLAVGIGKDQRIFAGPQLDYFLTPASRLNADTDPHLFRLGINVGMRIGKK